MRGERDRFVAFAFASASLLAELVPDYHIFFIAGSSGALVGQAPDQLTS
jgi:hypothetical protein